MATKNHSVILAERPAAGSIVPGKTFKHTYPDAPKSSELQDGEILVEVLYVSLDPAMRAWLNDARSYVAPVRVGTVMRAAAACRVLASRSKLAKPGDLVAGTPGWRQYAVLKDGTFEPASTFPGGVQRPHDVVSALGPTGLTAWWGMTQIGDPKPGETVVVSGAAGATGSVAGQIAKIRGARVVGICGSDDKCKWLTGELGFDEALNYKADDFKKRFKEATKDYIDVYYDNVGGEILDMCLSRAKEHARFVECGVVSQYNATKLQGLRNVANVVSMRIRLEGFIIFDHADAFPRARADLAKWQSEGRLKTTETIIKGGLDVVEQALLDLYAGKNTGKMLVELKSADEYPSKL